MDNFNSLYGDDRAVQICKETDIVIDHLVADVGRDFSPEDQQRLANRLKQMENLTYL